jgi:thiamine kinase-like enzyme
MSIEELCKQFKLPYDDFHHSILGEGLINDTYLISSGEAANKEKFVLQKINKVVFNEPDKVMSNLIKINEHLENKGSDCLKLIESDNGNLFVIDENYDYWRVTRYLENTRTLFEADDPVIAYEAAKSYGKFLNDIHDLNISEIYETIPGFHNYANRISQLNESIRIDNSERLRFCQKETEIILDKQKYISLFYELKLPIRVIHSDTKITNILFDADSYKGKLVIDLDISMPGSILYDFGDMVRSFTNTLQEDDPDLSSIDVKSDIFEQLTRGLLESTKPFILEKETNNLLLGAKLVVLIQAIRNLTDYLQGDVYYKINYEDHNLHRAQNQLKLLEMLEYHEDKLQKMIDKYR